jgi:hypothetical protein
MVNIEESLEDEIKDKNQDLSLEAPQLIGNDNT